jgi:hypothetical protein
MPRDHFAQMINSKSHRHDTPYDSYGFDQAVGALCGMLYSIVTLKAFFPKSPPLKMNNNPAKDTEGGDNVYIQLTLF